jgi:hypothetical protein
VDKAIRIKSFVRNILDPYEYTLTISDTVTSATITNRVISDLVELDKIVTINNLKDPTRARANWRSSREVLNMVFDPEGDYYTDKIKPNSIDTMALSVGAKSMQFGLLNTVFQPNFNGNPYLVNWKGGVLTHYTINEESTVSWVMADGSTTLTGKVPYYLYAKCEKNGMAGSFIFTASQIKVDEDANYYHFLVGTLSSIDPELKVRSLALTYGFTMVNGRFIKTGRIESADGTTYFDLDNSEIGGNLKFKAADGTMKNVSILEQNDLDYLSEIFINDQTDISGGVVLSGFIGVRDSQNNVVAAISGRNITNESESPLIYAGASRLSETLYGWTSDSMTNIYTKSNTPNNGDSCFNMYGYVIGEVESITGSQIFVLSTSGETFMRNTSIDKENSTTSSMNSNTAKFRVYKDGRCVAELFEANGAYKTIYEPVLTTDSRLNIQDKCHLLVAYSFQTGVMLPPVEDCEGYNVSICNIGTAPTTIMSNNENAISVLPPHSIMDLVCVRGRWIVKFNSYYASGLNNNH